MKSTKAEVRRRVSEVLKLRLGGAECPDIRDYASAPEQAWNVSDSQLRRYIQAADALCQEYFDAKAGHLLARHLLQRRQLYAHCMSVGDFRTALAVLKDEADLEALYPAGPVAPGPAAPDSRLGTAADVLALLEGQAGAVRAEPGAGAVEKARVVVSLAGVALKAIEATNLAARIEALEAVLKQR
jgi:hypothetical protein